MAGHRKELKAFWSQVCPCNYQAWHTAEHASWPQIHSMIFVKQGTDLQAGFMLHCCKASFQRSTRVT
eukprot:scaffold147582_cov19-Tisochrysis_lutea.AAC.1